MSLTEKITRPLTVEKKIIETSEACSLVFKIPNDLKTDFIYRPGQFVTLFLPIKGEEIKRSYSLSTSPFVDQEFKITVKKIPGGRASTHLMDEVQVGDVLRVTPPAGQFFQPPKHTGAVHYILFAGGSGITPLFSILKSVLFANEQNRVSLLYANRFYDHVIYKNELEQLQKKYSSRLNVQHLLTQPPESFAGLKGRLTRETFAAFYSTLQTTHPMECYLCGPVGFMQTAREQILAKGLEADRIHIESFGEAVGTSAHSESIHTPKNNLDNKTVIGQGNHQLNETPEKIIALLNGEEIEVQAVEGQTVLETLLAEGYSAPYSCMDGACMACMAKVREGVVYQDDPGILTEENVAAFETLTCQAKQLSRVVKIDFDNL